MKRKDLKNVILELTAPEGSEYVDFKVNRWGYKNIIVNWYGQHDKRKNKSVYIYVKVIGLKDSKATGSVRNWGKFSRTKI